MSFSGTPLGQARRLDRDTFLGKANGSGNRPPSPRRTVLKPSYTIPATTADARSAAKHALSSDDYDLTENEPALARFARQKQREAAAARPGAPKIITEPPNPTKWAVKDTTVNVASAFNQAAAATTTGSDMAYSNPNSAAWASGSRPATHVPRSTSVEYESQTSQTLNKRLAPPPSRFPGRPPVSSKPPSKNRSLQHVPDSEGEEQDPSGRGKSPFGSIVDAARAALKPAELYLRQRSTEPANQSRSFEHPQANGSRAGNDSSYNYEAEESFVQKQQRAERNNAKPKKGRISVDNQAWKPSTSDFEESDEDEEPEKRQRRKKNLSISRLTNLPTVVDGKTTKKRRPKGSKGAAGGDEDEGAASDDNTDISATVNASQLGWTAPPPRTRHSVEPPNISTSEFSMEALEAGLQSIPEVAEEDIVIQQPSKGAAVPEKPIRTRSRRGSRSTTPSPRNRFSVGVALGTLTRYFAGAVKGLVVLFFQILAGVSFFAGRILGTVYDVVLNQPLKWLSSGAARSLGKYIVLGLSILTAWYALQNPSVTSRIPSLPIPGRTTHAPVYTPGAPVANIDELVKRLTLIEAALSDLSQDTTKLKIKTDDSTRSYGDVIQRLGSVEGRITAETKRITDTESRERDALGKHLNSVKKEVETLHEQLEAQQRAAEKERALQQQKEKERERAAQLERERWEKEREQQQQQQRPTGPAADEQARALLRTLEQRVGTVEGGVKEALEIGKKLASAPPPPAVPAAPAASQSAAWWSKMVTKAGNKLKITTPDGQDVTGLISELVESAVSLQSKDTIAKADYALHSAGGRVIPSLTSGTFEIRPPSLLRSLSGLITGNGYAMASPPVVAIEPSLHAGRCWAMSSVQGQIGIKLAGHVYIDEVTVDHVPREVAFDVRSAPREMDVWGLVEGQDNVEKMWAYRTAKIAAKRAELEAAGEEVSEAFEEEELARMREGYPATLPKNPEYVRIARMEYDVHAPKHVQTFKVDESVKEMGVDFGVVVARVLSNWGNEAYTCLYRVRVHGKGAVEFPPPNPPAEEVEA